ncbi:hypothetical protein WISP_35278 [Willisornis vidua]|uniref:Uncharacterized protein n=1 Tax=Willisornis vidua TaxID=1566151 RepID=A0ABQ9DN67_9PASS|nr:hypothetical protein WISP_35278 [Willisornis vidua]
MKFNKGKCWILHLEWGKPGCTYRLGNEMLESSAMERHLDVLVDSKLNVALAARRANCVLGDIRHSIASWSREGIVLLFSAMLVLSVHLHKTGNSCELDFNRYYVKHSPRMVIITFIMIQLQFIYICTVAVSNVEVQSEDVNRIAFNMR